MYWIEGFYLRILPVYFCIYTTLKCTESLEKESRISSYNLRFTEEWNNPLPHTPKFVTCVCMLLILQFYFPDLASVRSNTIRFSILASLDIIPLKYYSTIFTTTGLTAFTTDWLSFHLSVYREYSIHKNCSLSWLVKLHWSTSLHCSKRNWKSYYLFLSSHLHREADPVPVSRRTSKQKIQSYQLQT